MNPKISFSVTLLLLAGLFTLWSVPLGPLPPIGSFFHPGQGFWANAEIRAVRGEIRLSSDHLREPVDIFFDERGVPHIFAQNDHDLYFAQGYVTARDRLFQMELQIRAAGGYLSEWLGEGLLEYDLHQRRLGMVYGAEQATEAIMNDEKVRGVIEAYSKGVNTWIESLRYETYPLEYKILDAAPEKWRPENSALLLKYMTQMLAGRSDDVRTSNTIARFGEEFADTFLSRRSELMDPIIPPGTVWEFDANPPDRPEEHFLPAYTEEIEPWQPHPLNGSNNWVVDGSRTADGFPILSNDMHLGMTLPSIWYEAQLHTPESNVYGVTLQGAPTVIVGFNDHIAWGSTNTGADVMDWYEITFRDDDRTEYLHDGEWLPVKKRVESIQIKGAETVTDTVRYTHHGPVYQTQSESDPSETIHRDFALRWIAHRPSNELLAFYRLNRAESYDDFRHALSEFQSPAQNINFASVDGNIAMQTAGLLPKKWEYQGRAIGDGSDSQYDWHGYIPFEENPHALNPERGFLSAANQYPADLDYPYYLGDFFAPFERGRRINELLREMENITTKDFRDMLMDTFSYHAAYVLPAMIESLDATDFSPRKQELLNRLAEWNYMNDGDAVEPSLFHTWWEWLSASVWDNKFESEYPMRRPQRDVTADLIVNHPDSEWLNDLSTEETETLSDLARKSFILAIEELESRYGDDSGEWLWGVVNQTDLNHVGQIQGLGASEIFTGGGRESINAIYGSHGPSWRMVVELNPEGVRGHGIYPGGQTGNPGSPTYEEFIEPWRTGQLFELLFLRDKPEDDDPFPLMIRME